MATERMARRPLTRSLWTPTRDFQLFTLVDEHQSYEAISSKLGATVTSIRIRCKKLGIALSRSGLSPTAVAKKMGLAHSTVRYWIDHGWLTATASGLGTRQRGLVARLVEYETLLSFLEDRRYWHHWSPLKIVDRNLATWAGEMRAGGWFLTTAEVARLIGIGKRAVQYRCAQGTIPAIRLGNNWLIRVADLHIAATAVGAVDQQNTFGQG